MGRLSVLNHQICTKHASWDTIRQTYPGINVSAQDSSYSIALAMELPQCSTMPLICTCILSVKQHICSVGVSQLWNEIMKLLFMSYFICSQMVMRHTLMHQIMVKLTRFWPRLIHQAHWQSHLNGFCLHGNQVLSNTDTSGLWLHVLYHDRVTTQSLFIEQWVNSMWPSDNI